MSIDTKYFKDKLLKELERLEKELSDVGRKNPDNPADWEAKPSEEEVIPADENVLADRMEDYTENNALVNQLEPRLRDVRSALDKIEKGTYGLCEVSGEEIEGDRLEANPAARTCKAHMN